MLDPKNITIVALIVVGGVLLQIFLSIRENKFLGLILPAISFLLSVIFMMMVINNESLAHPVFVGLATLGLYNVPTLVFLTVYFKSRKSKTKQP